MVAQPCRTDGSISPRLFISKEVLDILSYHSTLGRSLKQISLRKTPLPIILDDIEKYRASYIDTIFQENLIGSRFKSEDSIKRKYEKTLKTGAHGSRQAHCLQSSHGLPSATASGELPPDPRPNG